MNINPIKNLQILAKLTIYACTRNALAIGVVPRYYNKTGQDTVYITRQGSPDVGPLYRNQNVKNEKCIVLTLNVPTCLKNSAISSTVAFSVNPVM